MTSQWIFYVLIVLKRRSREPDLLNISGLKPKCNTLYGLCASAISGGDGFLVSNEN
jgi:hypothetical protein